MKMNTFIILAIISLPVFIYSSTYFVSASGDDSNSGTETSPFRTIQRAFNQSNPGDIINVKNGEYATISVSNFGGNSESDLTIIQAYSGRPVINNSNGDWEINSSGNILIKGFEFNGVQLRIRNNSHHIYIEDNIIHDSRFPVDIYSSNHCFIRRNIIYGNNNGLRRGEVGVRLYNSDYNLVELNTIYNMHSDYSNGDGIGIFQGSSYNIISKNIVHDNPDDNLDGWYSGGNNIVQHNSFYRAGYGENGQITNGDGKGCKTNYSSHHWIVRFNTSYNNSHEGISDEDSDGNNTFYNNTSYNNGESNFQNFVNNNYAFKNNISCGINRNAGLFDSQNGNIHTSNSSEYINWFIDPASYNFNLDVNSPLVDAGVFLTRTSNAGDGTAIYVDDARYFIDGYSLIDGDIIKIGSNNPVMVVELDYQNNHITVDRSISWNENDPVSYYFYGSAPDVGSLEYNRDNSNILAPQNISIGSN